MESVCQSAAAAPSGPLFSSAALPLEVTQGGKYLPLNTFNQLAWHVFLWLEYSAYRSRYLAESGGKKSQIKHNSKLPFITCIWHIVWFIWVIAVSLFSKDSLRWEMLEPPTSRVHKKGQLLYTEAEVEHMH